MTEKTLVRRVNAAIRTGELDIGDDLAAIYATESLEAEETQAAIRTMAEKISAWIAEKGLTAETPSRSKRVLLVPMDDGPGIAVELRPTSKDATGTQRFSLRLHRGDMTEPDREDILSLSVSEADFDLQEDERLDAKTALTSRLERLFVAAAADGSVPAFANVAGYANNLEGLEDALAEFKGLTEGIEWIKKHFGEEGWTALIAWFDTAQDADATEPEAETDDEAVTEDTEEEVSPYAEDEDDTADEVADEGDVTQLFG